LNKPKSINMKKTFLSLAFLLAVSCLVAQSSPVCITTDKTVSLVFPSPILYVDRGTGDVLVQLVEGANQILLVKAASRNFSPTNLSVITADDSVYALQVVYGEPSVLVYRFHPKPYSVADDCNRLAQNRRS
jgi:hypothetical protein